MRQSARLEKCHVSLRVHHSSIQTPPGRHKEQRSLVEPRALGPSVDGKERRFANPLKAIAHTGTHIKAQAA
mgnify:CR=1 FL=1